MVKALVNISDEANQVLNIVKAKFRLRDKSEAINVMARQYDESILEPELRPEFIAKMKRIHKEPTIKVKDFKKHFGLK